MSSPTTFPPFQVTAEVEAEASERIAHYPANNKRSAVLPLLHIVQHKFGFISKDAIIWIAEKLELEEMQVYEVVSFYPGFREHAPGKYHFRVCRTLPCAMAGSAELMEKICELTGIDRSKSDSHHNPIAVSPCGKWSVEFAECLASCGTGPVCLVNDEFHEAITTDKAKALLTQYQD
ncbi:MAG: NAD(P)H-dependent oxidoreductase subunit E [Akkermansiaceae bacterium]